CSFPSRRSSDLCRSLLDPIFTCRFHQEQGGHLWGQCIQFPVLLLWLQRLVVGDLVAHPSGGWFSSPYAYCITSKQKCSGIAPCEMGGRSGFCTNAGVLHGLRGHATVNR